MSGRARPRLWETASNVGANMTEIAYHLGMSVSRFEALREKLEANGMPKRDPLTGTWCVPAVDEWWKLRHGLEEASSDQLSGDIGEWSKSR